MTVDVDEELAKIIKYKVAQSILLDEPDLFEKTMSLVEFEMVNCVYKRLKSKRKTAEVLGITQLRVARALNREKRTI